MFRRLLIILLACFICPVFAAANRDAATGDKEAELIYLAAKASMAAYTDRDGRLFTRFFDDWQWERVAVGADERRRLFLARRGDLYILALAGTQSARDVKTDLKTRPVPFPAQKAARVHAGFLSYARDALAEGVLTGAADGRLYTLLQDNPRARLLLTGHSMGGAAAVALAASLAGQGGPAERLRVITFGAPAVGNKAFAEYCAGKFSLLRVYSSLDPVPGGLQKVSAYTQFGRGLLMKGDPRYKLVQHGMADYADFAGKNYYDWRRDRGQEEPDAASGDVALVIVKGDNVYDLTDYEYMLKSLADIYRAQIPGLRLASSDFKARRLIQVRLEVGRVKSGKGNWLVSLEVALLNADGSGILAAGSFNHQTRVGASLMLAAAHAAFKSASFARERAAEN